MSTAPLHQPISVHDYLEGEQSARRKHEFVEGVIYAMVGATNVHNRIATNATGILHGQLRGRKCQVFNSDTKIRVCTERGTRFYYPDVSVACQLNPPSDSFQDQPVVILEVVSESTRRTDELEKRDAYLSIATLGAYLLIEQASPTVVVYRRGEGGFVREVYAGCEAVAPLPEIGCQLPLADLYENVEFTAAAEDDEGD